MGSWLKRYRTLALGLVAYTALAGALLAIAEREGAGVASAQQPAGILSDVLDLRTMGGPNLCAGGRQVVGLVDQAVAAGYSDIKIPAGCVYTPDGGTTPADVTIEGSNWETSIVSSVDPTHDVALGPRSILKNVAVSGAFCSGVGAMVCPIAYLVNASDLPYTVVAYPATGFSVNTGNSVTFSGQTSATAPLASTVSASGALLAYATAALPRCTSLINGMRTIVNDAGFPVVWLGPVPGAPGPSGNNPGVGGGQIRSPVSCIKSPGGEPMWVFG